MKPCPVSRMVYSEGLYRNMHLMFISYPRKATSVIKSSCLCCGIRNREQVKCVEPNKLDTQLFADGFYMYKNQTFDFVTFQPNQPDLT